MFAKRKINLDIFLKTGNPIILLNIIYTLISGCLSLRIKSIFDFLIFGTQSNFLKEDTLKKIQN